MPIPQTHSLTLIQKIQLTPDVFELRFGKPDTFSYRAGQFLQFVIPDNEASCLRAYSLSSKPSDDYLECCVKIIPEGRASALFQRMSVGDDVTCKGPFGRFINSHPEISLNFIATGVGLAPIMGIIADELHGENNPQAMHLLFGIRHEQDMFWLERLETFARDFAQFSYTVTISQPTDTWDGATGRVTAYLTGTDSASPLFVCGSAEMVKDVRRTMLDRGMDPSNIHIEIF